MSSLLWLKKYLKAKQYFIYFSLTLAKNTTKMRVSINFIHIKVITVCFLRECVPRERTILGRDNIADWTIYETSALDRVASLLKLSDDWAGILAKLAKGFLFLSISRGPTYLYSCPHRGIEVKNHNRDFRWCVTKDVHSKVPQLAGMLVVLVSRGWYDNFYPTRSKRSVIFYVKHVIRLAI